MNGEDATIFRRKNIGFVFQQYNLITSLSAYENIVLPVQLDDSDADEAYLVHIFELLGIEKLLDKLPSQLSGGQQQRVAIARALSNKPKILLCDEPTGNLDTRTTKEVLDLLKDTSQNLSQTIIMITHNDDIARQADNIICIEDGKIIN